MHARLRRLYLRNDARGFSPDVAAKLRRQLAYLENAPDLTAIANAPQWKAHQLSGRGPQTWSFHVTANWRLTFQVVNGQIVEVNYEDYHGDR